MVTNYLYDKIPDHDTDLHTDLHTDHNTDLHTGIDESTQTDFINYTSFQTNPTNSIAFSNFETNHYFKHLQFANQSYFEHFQDSLFYCGISLKSAFYFFCHGIWPDSFQQNGSETIHDLSNIIYEKYQQRIEELHRIN
jgi:hypothetical protein